mmetsp:Transcript_42062/g.51001  ORF Transcript_42062/g.51001 Transcript_42062/m.51001 type:complete len:260 (+) Transcript_42062:177-956(+)|eukprot:CAMPEP_0197845360 /NCGR_PEP_ID=MMETSP1438-20131217/2303_1 /TAXON_ID=1461541 /ORGANISM="Pterosperma sp., Strain CCMP1384" /LENGTH=259 /DNA_ID=CAMNT_0043456627 /DNA_START=228 /DNA_END=1007 /DNA_ORIENTATION=+
MPSLYLDSAIRSWVLVPITLAMFLLGVLRHWLAKYMKGADAKVELKTVREGQALIRARRLRENAGYLPRVAFGAKKLFFTDKETGLLYEKKNDKPANPMAALMGGGGAGGMQDPTMLVDMMKRNMSTFIPQILAFNWVSFFFSGFVVAKVPFPLTMRFRGMLQRGIDLQSLDVTYVSSLSWYFLNLFGLRGVFSLVLGENTIDDTQIMQQQMMMGPNEQQAAAAYAQERDNLELLDHHWVLPTVESVTARLLRSKLKKN